jgi:hypothetical protein
MNKKFSAWFYIISLLLILISGCIKNHKSELDKLPVPTFTGANTFGCLINGKAFVPKGYGLNGSVLHGGYSYNFGSATPTFTFSISATNEADPCNLTNISLVVADSVFIETGKTYPLITEKPLTPFGQYNHYSCGGIDDHLQTTDTITGQLLISRFDIANNIGSGLFEFNVLKLNGDTVKITNGRFDLRLNF